MKIKLKLFLLLVISLSYLIRHLRYAALCVVALYMDLRTSTKNRYLLDYCKRQQDVGTFSFCYSAIQVYIIILLSISNSTLSTLLPKVHLIISEIIEIVVSLVYDFNLDKRQLSTKGYYSYVCDSLQYGLWSVILQQAAVFDFK